MIESIRQAPGGVLYTSDHGEAFREHHQMGHTFSIFDEEIKVRRARGIQRIAGD